VEYIARVPSPPLDRFIDDFFAWTELRVTGA
jgi:hypothetical protein